MVLHSHQYQGELDTHMTDNQG